MKPTGITAGQNGPFILQEKLMLVLTRKTGEEIVIDEDIRVVVTAIHRGNVRLGISAPRSVRVDRQELHQARSVKPHPGAADAVDDDGIA